MTNTLTLEYLGDYQTKSNHSASGSEIYTDAPIDNGGQSRTFAASDLICSALCSCMMTMMGIMAKKQGIVIHRIQAQLSKTMQKAPRKISKIEILFTGETTASAEQTETLIAEARKCPFQLGLSENLETSFVFNL